MDNPNGFLTSARASKRERAIAALLQHTSVAKAAEAIGVNPSTVWRWLKDPEFQRKLTEAQSAMFSQSMRCLQQAAPAASATLVHTMRDPGTPAHTRVRASEAVLKVSQQTLQHALLAQRVAELERSRSQNQPPVPPRSSRKSTFLPVVPLLLFLLPLIPWLTARVLAPTPSASFRNIDARLVTDSVDSDLPLASRVVVEDFSGRLSSWIPSDPARAERLSPISRGETQVLPEIGPTPLTPRRWLTPLPKCEARVWLTRRSTAPVSNGGDREPDAATFCNVANPCKPSQDSARLCDP